jgi:hypothetical protein
LAPEDTETAVVFFSDQKLESVDAKEVGLWTLVVSPQKLELVAANNAGLCIPDPSFQKLESVAAKGVGLCMPVSIHKGVILTVGGVFKTGISTPPPQGADPQEIFPHPRTAVLYKEQHLSFI